MAKSEFPEAQEIPADATDLINPPKNACAACGEEVLRSPGSRGRIPKYHVECKPVKGASRESAPRPVRVTAKDKQAAEEVELAIERARRGLGKAVALLSLADPYDAFVLHVNSADLLENLRPVLMRFPWLREQASNASAGVSIFGLIVTVFTTALPIAAHHNLIPSKKVASILLNMPVFMLRLQERMAQADNGDMSEELLHRIAEESRKKQEAQMRQRTSTENVSASPTG